MSTRCANAVFRRIVSACFFEVFVLRCLCWRSECGLGHSAVTQRSKKNLRLYFSFSKTILLFQVVVSQTYVVYFYDHICNSWLQFVSLSLNSLEMTKQSLVNYDLHSVPCYILAHCQDQMFQYFQFHQSSTAGLFCTMHFSSFFTMSWCTPLSLRC